MWPARMAAASSVGSKRMPNVARVSIRFTEVSSIACTSATTASQTTTSSRARASPIQTSDACACCGSPMRMSSSTDESSAITGRSQRSTGSPGARPRIARIASSVVATGGALLERALQKGVDMKSENDLTV